MKNRAKLCLYIFLICAFFALGVGGYFLFNNGGDQVMLGSRKFQVFSSVPNASYYSVLVQDHAEANTGQAEYKVNRQSVELDKNTFNFTVEVKIAGEKKAEEHYTQYITRKDDNTGKIDCKIKDYTIIFFSDGIEIERRSSYLDQSLTNVDSDIFCFVVNVYFDNLFKTDGAYKIIVTPLDDDGNEIKGENEESLVAQRDYNYTAYYEEDFLKRGEFFYGGKWHDYVVESKNELNSLVWWAILYRQAQTKIINGSRVMGNLRFFVKTGDINSSNINRLVIDAINAYPEYDALEDQNIYGKKTGNIGALVDFNYYLHEDFLLTYKDLKDMDTTTGDIFYNQALASLRHKNEDFEISYIGEDSTETRTDDTFDLLANEEKKGVTVYNTEQLFMVVQNGEKPIIEDEESVVYQVWNNALTVLRNINKTDSLSDYEKALNIYRYICGEIIYDDVIYDYMKVKQDFSIKNFGNFSCFYLEGVFYDFDGLNGNKYAVCDGLAKAYSLLCNIEGIDCIKVNGKVDGGNHAWNRIELHDEDYGADGFYYVDPTWGEGVYDTGEPWQDGEKTFERKNFQLLTHTYFLTEHEQGREILYPKNLESETPASDYNYYDFAEFEYDGETIDCYVETDEELTKLLEYAESKVTVAGDSFVLELKFDANYLALSDTLISDLLDEDTDIAEWFSDIGVNNSKEWLNLIGISNVIIFRIYK